MKDFELVIGLETHVQLKTESKMFCETSAAYFGTTPNTHTCPVCLGLPGALPVINEKAIEAAIKIGLALNCKINPLSRFERKNYFYPDLPKGYQISQFELPLSYEGWMYVEERKIRINRAHMEEDTGKLTHASLNGEKVSLIDFNRSSVPLLEIVTEPDLTSPQEAKLYAKNLHRLLRYLSVADGDMEKAGMRFDANLSIRPRGEKRLGTKVELKNINSFNFLEKALFVEAARQLDLVSKGEVIVQETRGWDETSGTTKPQRTKETSPDYRYFPDPDLPPLTFQEAFIARIKKTVPELPNEKKVRFETEYGLSGYDANLLVEDPLGADFFEKTVEDLNRMRKNQEKFSLDAKNIANWLNGEVLRNLKDNNQTFEEINFEPAALAELIYLVDEGKISNATAKQVLGKMFSSGNLPSKIMDEEGLVLINSEGQIEKIVDQVLSNNEKAIQDYKKGKQESIGFLIGQVMRLSKGQIDHKKVAEVLKKKLN